MTLKKLLEQKQIKQLAIVNALGTTKQGISDKLKRNCFNLNELTLLRIKNILTLEDVDLITK